ncbi:hypothetical protein [Paenibacillus eucommiae]|uniref:Cytochrome c oxidase subunit 2 n=1 Tax=Paenibacillus eucommiae TaxID=1355755 RepID=A0ABS4IN13_9BACL|nr:hypothetical protein [Paenibacillus eucommiae]MBP1988958.1 cytochrome c oxidase subunit 2 [Paenibacillus eucommiae]
MYKWVYFVLFISASVLGVGVLFQNISAHRAEIAAESEDAGKSLKIVASNWHFDEPEYKVTKGDKLKVSLVQKEGIHAVHITGEGLDVTLDKNNPSQEISFDAAGNYEVICVLPCGEGHADMKSTLIVQ